jgi:DNA-binding CsgD family transcriptional regulator
LSRREKQILGLLLDGLSTRQVSVALGTKEGTIHSHVYHMLGKTSLRDRDALKAWAQRERVLAAPET